MQLFMSPWLVSFIGMVYERKVVLWTDWSYMTKLSLNRLSRGLLHKTFTGEKLRLFWPECFSMVKSMVKTMLTWVFRFYWSLSPIKVLCNRPQILHPFACIYSLTSLIRPPFIRISLLSGRDLAVIFFFVCTIITGKRGFQTQSEFLHKLTWITLFPT